MQTLTELVMAILGAAGGIAAAIRWSAGVMARAIDRNTRELARNHDATVDNTQALQMNTGAREGRSGLMKKGATAAGALLLVLMVTGCPSVPQQTVEDMQFAEKAWEEDKRPDLEPDVVTARRKFFHTAKETARKGAGK